MDVAGCLLASGFALLVVLLGWSNQITSKSKETKELEAEFLEKANLKDKEYKSIIDQGGATKNSLTSLVGFLYDKNRDKDDIEILNAIKDVKKGLVDIDRKYRWRFWLLIFTTGFLFITGIEALFIPNNKIALIPNIFPIALIFKNLITLHILENKYSESMSIIMEKL